MSPSFSEILICLWMVCNFYFKFLLSIYSFCIRYTRRFVVRRPPAVVFYFYPPLCCPPSVVRPPLCFYFYPPSNVLSAAFVVRRPPAVVFLFYPPLLLSAASAVCRPSIVRPPLCFIFIRRFCCPPSPPSVVRPPFCFPLSFRCAVRPTVVLPSNSSVRLFCAAIIISSARSSVHHLPTFTLISVWL